MDDRSLMSYNHGDAFLTYLQQLQQQERFTDVVIQCEGRLLSICHRLILAAFSTHFETALAGVENSSQITLDIDPKITGVTVDTLKRIVEFFYTGRVEPTPSLYKSALALGANTLAVALETAGDGVGLLEDPEHGANLLAACRRFYVENRFTDVAIHCQGIYLMSCHRLLLCAYSDHFEAALTNTESCPQVTLDIDPTVTGVARLDLHAIIEFMYNGCVRIVRRRVKGLAAAGRALGVTKLSELLSMHEQKYSNQLNSGQHHMPVVGGAAFGPDSAVIIAGDDTSGHNLGNVQFVSLVSDSDAYGVVETVGASVDVTGGHGGVMDMGEPVPEPDMGAETLMIDGFTTEETTMDEDPDEIYDEYVSGPRRRKNPLGTHRGQIKIKSRQYKRRAPAVPHEDDSDALGMFMDESRLDPDRFVCDTDTDVAAVTLTMVAPLAKRRRMYSSDTFGYGLPEIVATADVTVPLLVGDQQLMMEKPFKCPYCDHRTKEKSALEKHVRCIHTLETPYRCRYCNQAFKVQSNLVRHIRAHTGEKPYVCKKCGAAYADKKNMDAHVFREHLKMKPLECPSAGCTAKFWRQDRFNYHCRRQHNLEPPELTQI